MHPSSATYDRKMGLRSESFVAKNMVFRFRVKPAGWLQTFCPKESASAELCLRGRDFTTKRGILKSP